MPWSCSFMLIRSRRRAPFSCGRFGASSTTPFFTSPGTATPTASRFFSPFAACNNLLADRLYQRIGVQLHQRVHSRPQLSGKRRKLAHQLVVHHQPRMNLLR